MKTYTITLLFLPLILAGQTKKMTIIPPKADIYIERKTIEIRQDGITLKSATTLPLSVDWSRFDSPVRSQGACGSCWAFATCALIENYHNRFNLKYEADLSEQELISCSGAGSCSGGWPPTALDFIKENGISPEYAMKYTGVNAECFGVVINPIYKNYIDSQYSPVSYPVSVEKLKNALLKGPFIVSMKVYSDFYAYKSGIYNYDGVSPYSSTHAVLLVGYDDVSQCFTIKNSWSDSRGEKGYYRIGYANVTNKVFFGSGNHGIYHVYQKASEVYKVLDTIVIDNRGDATLNILSIKCDASWIEFTNSKNAILPSFSSLLYLSIDWNKVPVFDSVSTAVITITSNDSEEPNTTIKVIARRNTIIKGTSIVAEIINGEPEYPAVSSSGKIGVNISSESGIWKAINNSSWIHLSTNEGKSGIISFTIDENNTKVMRIAAIRFQSNTDSQIHTDIFIRQNTNRPPTANLLNIYGYNKFNFNSTLFKNVYSDPDGDSLTLLKFTSLPPHGILSLNGIPIVPNQSILLKDINHLEYESINEDYTGVDIIKYHPKDNSNFSLYPCYIYMRLNKSYSNTRNPMDDEDSILIENSGNSMNRLILKGQYNGIVNIKIYDLNGKIIKIMNEYKNQHTLLVNVSLKGLSSGIYLFVTSYGDKVYKSKMVVL